MKALEEIIEKILPILEAHEVIHASIFGSFARGDNTSKSDIDIIVELPDGKSLLDLISIKLDIEEKINLKVDITTKNALSPHMMENISNEMVTVL